jgi:sulfur carrier protein
VTITVNGEPRTLAPGAAVTDLLPPSPQGMAVARNGEVVPRAQHATTPLVDGDVIEIVTAVQGG